MGAYDEIPFDDAELSPQEILANPVDLSRNDRTCKWDYGIDIAWASVSLDQYFYGEEGPDLEAFRNNSFKRDQQPLAAGDQVGIAIYTTQQVTIESVASENNGYRPDVDAGNINLQELYGPALCITIYTGRILWVGEHHIEYEMNTFKGCTGAIVFRLEPDIRGLNTGAELDTWRPTVVAIHAGHEPKLGANIGFTFPACQEARVAADEPSQLTLSE